MNPNFDRWIFASISTYFKENKPPEIPMRIEGKAFDDTSDYIDFRMTGPIWQRISKSVWQADMSVNILVNLSATTSTDAHKIYRITGALTEKFGVCIGIYRYGPTTGVDDQARFSTAYPIKNGNTLIETIHYGQVNNQTRIVQATVEGYYRIRFRNN